MTQEFVPYQEALELKELEFDEPCLGLYHDDCMFSVSPCIAHEQYYRQVCMAPLYSQAFKWFREKHELMSEIVWMSALPTHNTFSARIKSSEKTEYMEECNSYEEAELACLRKLIELVKQQS